MEKHVLKESVLGIQGEAHHTDDNVEAVGAFLGKRSGSIPADDSGRISALVRSAIGNPV